MTNTVQVYDLESQKLTTIPAAELAPGMIFSEVAGVGNVWVKASSSMLSDSYRHPPFDESVRDFIKKIKKGVDEVFPMSLEKWEDGFRKDSNPQREIAIWLHIAARYTCCVQGKKFSKRKRKDIFNIMLACANNPIEHVRNVIDKGSLSRAQMEQAIACFFGSALD